MKALITLFVLGIVFLNSGLTFANNDKAYKLYKEKKYNESRDLYKKQCKESNTAQDCINYAILLEWTNQFEIAFPINQKYCELNKSTACANLGRFYWRKKDWHNSARSYKKACKLNDEDSCHNLGKLVTFEDVTNAL
jgi:TPR repeat protein